MNDLRAFYNWLKTMDCTTTKYTYFELLDEFYSQKKDPILIDEAKQIAVLKNLKPSDLIIFQAKTDFTAEQANNLQTYLENVCKCKVLLVSKYLDVAKLEVDFKEV